MRVRIAYTIEAPDDWRRAIRLFYGREGLATREEVKRWVAMYGTSADDDLMWALQQHAAEERERNYPLGVIS